MSDHRPDHSTLRRIYEEILPLFQAAAAGEWAWFDNPAIESVEAGGPVAPDACPPRIQGDVRCWQVVQWRSRADRKPTCLPIACPECAVWQSARPTLVEELGEAFNSLMYRLGRLDQSLEQAAALTRHLAGEWEELELENRAIRENMSRDALTGLYNRQQLDRDLDAAIALSDRRHRPVTVAMFDIDHFKDFNDTYGHIEGDRVLAQCGRLLDETTRAEDRCYRYGGEEFAILFLDTPLPLAQGICERLRRRFAQLSFTVTDERGMETRVHKTISGGMAQYRPGMNRQELLSLADQALYAAKRAGRNRVMYTDTCEPLQHPVPVPEG